jgi:uncharacterized protein
VVQFQEQRFSITLQSKSNKLFGIIHLPEMNIPAPAVLMLHGFGSNKIGTHRRYVDMASRLAKVGIACFRFDFSGAGDSEGEIGNVTIDDLVEDALVATQFLQNHPCIDRKKLGILGSSLGGSLAILVSAKTKAFIAQALWAPVFSGKLWLESYSQKPKETQGGQQPFTVDPQTQSAYFRGIKLHSKFVEQFIALNVENSLKALSDIPLLHIQGGKDYTVSAMQGNQFRAIRNQVSAPTRMITLEQSGHDFNIVEERETKLHETQEWFTTYLS